MYLKHLGLYITFLLWNTLLLAMPSVQILQSCKNGKAANNKIVMSEIEGVGYNDQEDLNCKNQFDTEIDGKLYGSVTCSHKAYLIIANKKISTETAKNYSLNPAVKPTTPILQAAGWWRIIDKDKKNYLCIQSPLSDTGSASNLWQYYLIEDPFNANRENYDIYFYFFNK